MGLNWSETQSLVEKWHPSIAVANRSINLFNDNVMQHFRKKNKQNQMALDRFLSKEKSSGGNGNERPRHSSGG
jgi:hypothetical protein